MALEIDPFAVMRALAAHPAAFPDIRAEAAKAAGAFAEKLRGLLVRQIRAKGATLATIRQMREALGAEPFALVADGLKASELKTLIAKFDRHHPGQKSADTAWRRGHLRALIEGTAEPAAKATPRSRPKPPTAARGGRRGASAKAKSPPDQDDFLFDPSAGAVRARRQRI